MTGPAQLQLVGLDPLRDDLSPAERLAVEARSRTTTSAARSTRCPRGRAVPAAVADRRGRELHSLRAPGPTMRPELAPPVYVLHECAVPACRTLAFAARCEAHEDNEDRARLAAMDAAVLRAAEAEELMDCRRPRGPGRRRGGGRAPQTRVAPVPIDPGRGIVFRPHKSGGRRVNVPPMAQRSERPMSNPQTTPPIPAVLYAAKSTTDRHDSIPIQLADAREMAADNGCRTVVDEFHDEGFSAYSGNRGPDLERAKARAVRAAAETGGLCMLVAQAHDRFAPAPVTDRARRNH